MRTPGSSKSFARGKSSPQKEKTCADECEGSVPSGDPGAIRESFVGKEKISSFRKEETAFEELQTIDQKELSRARTLPKRKEDVKLTRSAHATERNDLRKGNLGRRQRENLIGERESRSRE